MVTGARVIETIDSHELNPSDDDDKYNMSSSVTRSSQELKGQGKQNLAVPEHSAQRDVNART